MVELCKEDLFRGKNNVTIGKERNRAPTRLQKATEDQDEAVALMVPVAKQPLTIMEWIVAP